MHTVRLTPWLAICLLAGCQVVAGLTSLDTDAGAGGATSNSGGAGGATTTGGMGGAGDGGEGGMGDGGEGGEDDCTEDCGLFACDGGACLEACVDSEGCADDAICEMPTSECILCGDQAGGTPMGCPGMCPATMDNALTGQCMGGTNAPVCRYSCANCNTTETLPLEARDRPAEIFCDDGTCNGVTFQCRGPFGCTLICTGSSCNGTRLICNAFSPCEVRCEGMSACTGAGVIQECRQNVCSAQCTNGSARVFREGCDDPDRKCDCEALPGDCEP